MLALVEPDVRLHTAWLDAHLEWGPGQHEDGFGLTAADEVVTPAGFGEWVAGLHRSRSEATGSGLHSSGWWVVEDGDEVLGGIGLRYGDEAYIQRFGHVGFGIRPSARGRGVASWAVRAVLEVARTRGMGRVLAICEVGNVPSAATLVRCGGVEETVHGQPGSRVRRFWLPTS